MSPCCGVEAWREGCQLRCQSESPWTIRPILPLRLRRPGRAREQATAAGAGGPAREREGQLRVRGRREILPGGWITSPCSWIGRSVAVVGLDDCRSGRHAVSRERHFVSITADLFVSCRCCSVLRTMLASEGNW
ncbi:hypothetical protein AVEN_15718-1 [Araneus ventricosus]|uniref:Uncharacterized protein n=1 Tax=Araneus ventricosus TaxID=182803 RepID=A0A4Y2RVN3_ARAVE|nr:hypothetical protein AVEN_15718-1 [Araneus ventricosus]